MDNVRCYFRDGDALARVDVNKVEDYYDAILEVKMWLMRDSAFGKPPTVLAIVQ